MVTLTIDKRSVTVSEGTTILEAAAKLNIHIPTLCYLKDINEIGACRICCVEVEGYERLLPACETPAEDGMVVSTSSVRVLEARRTNLQLILSRHDANCPNCLRNGNCTLQQLAADNGLHGNDFNTAPAEDIIDPASPIVRYNSKCIGCLRCVQVCDKVQDMHIWDLIGTGSRSHIGLSVGGSISASDCTFCGQCVTHCPVGALTERDDTATALEALEDKECITVVQIAPAVRSAWAEYFGMEHNSVTTGQLVTALKMLGFDYVFDTNFAADLTIMEEGSEFIERFTHKEDYSWPMFTSCCPGWVRFIKSQFPEMVPCLSTAKSPQQMFGAVAKNWFAAEKGIKPENLRVISVMPCTAKKNEAGMASMRGDNGDPDVDVVLTTREMVRMLRAAYINPGMLEETPFDSPLGTGTGAAVIFGATGGVMDAALRTAYYLTTGSEPDPDAFSAVRGMDGWKESKFEIPGVGQLSVAVVSGLGNARRLMEAISTGEVRYDFVEVMACPGGCAGGGGQPIHDGFELADTRGKVLWNLDKGEKIRFSHRNPDVTAIYNEFLGAPLSEKAHHLLHTCHN